MRLYLHDLRGLPLRQPTSAARCRASLGDNLMRVACHLVLRTVAGVDLFDDSGSGKRSVFVVFQRAFDGNPGRRLRRSPPRPYQQF